MSKIKYIVLVSIIFLLTKFCVAQELTPEQVYAKVCNSVLLAYSYDENGHRLNQGSAVVINDRGYVVTNFHIFTGGVKIEFEKNGEKIKDVQIIGADPDMDVLILKIEGNKFPPVKPADSDLLKVGQKVYTLGNPLGYENTFSEGIITAIRDHLDDYEGRQIQYSASTSHGNSGGALLNNYGELIGITSSTMEKGQNLNFAIPINDFLSVNIVDYDDSVQVKAINSLCLGYSCYKNGSYFRAEKLYEEYLGVFPNDANAFILAGRNFYERSLFDSAITKYLHAIELRPANKYAFYYLGNSYSGKHDSVNAIASYSKAIELDSSYCIALLARGLQFELGPKSYENALRDYDNSLRVKPDYTFIHLYKGKVLLYLGDTVNGISELDASVDYEIDIASTCYERGQLFADLGYHQDAIEDFTQAIKLETENDSYYFDRAIEYSKQSRHLNAVNDYQQVIKLNPYYSSAYNNLGYEYYHLRDYEQAISNFNRSLQINKNEFDSYLGLSIVSFTRNELSDCKKYINNAAEIRHEIKKGMNGIKLLENKGFFWSHDEKEVLNKIFKLVGYNCNDEGTPERKHRFVRAESKRTK